MEQAMFEPPRCPNLECSAHRDPEPGFWWRDGSYRRRCRHQLVPRFRCRRCRRSFSRQTFRADYRDHKPYLNAKVFSRLVSGCGLRQTARELGTTRRTTELKFRKMARHLGFLHRNLIGEFPREATFQLDEMETFEGCRSTRPLTVPLLIEQESMFLVDARCAPIPPSGRKTPKRRRAIAAEEARNGRRPNRSRECVAKVLGVAAAHCRHSTRITFHTDRKSTYPNLIRQAFGAERVDHHRTSSKRPRDTRNPLFRINLMNAIARDLLGRLHRRSWLVSKRGEYLDAHLALLAAYRNYHRPRFNKDTDSPAMLLGFVDRRLTKSELLSWRQDWGRQRSIHPLARRLESVGDYRGRRAA
jgi:hypothetical protein